MSGYFDLQVNGYGGVDYNAEDLNAESLHKSCEHLKRDGVSAILATVITEQVPVMCSRLAKLVALRERDPVVREMIAGLHIEGPFINETKGFVGAHPPDAVRVADEDTAKRLVDAGGGLTRIVTLAPERDPGFRVTGFLAKAGVTVSAGHCDASIEQLSGAIDAGLKLYTHLGNGCPMQVNRHDNIVQRVLSLSDRIHPCFIADGVHVPMFALKNYIRLVGVDRCAVVTDAIAAAGLGPGRYKFSRWDLQIGDDLAARAPDGSHLVGSAMTMPQNEANLRKHLSLTEAECRTLLCDNPRKFVNVTA